MTVTLYNAETGETQTVGSIEGYDQAVWQIIADKPASNNGEVWIYENGEWVEVIPPTPPAPRFEQLLDILVSGRFPTQQEVDALKLLPV